MSSNKLQYFEGIRGLAALIVVFHHLDFVLSLNLDTKVFNFIYNLSGFETLSNISQSIFSFFLNGNLAIFTFFFMSGYVISIKLFTGNSKTYLISAISKRYFRLMPPILGSILISFFLMKFNLIYNIELSTVLGTENTLGYFYNFNPSFLSAFKSGVWNVLFTTNRAGYNGPLWTMMPEFYGSLLCFLTFIIFNRIKKRHYIYIIILLTSLLIKTPWITSFILGFLICDLDYSTNWLKHLSKLTQKYIFTFTTLSVILCISIIIIDKITGFNKWPYSNTITSFLLVFITMKSKGLQKIFQLKPFLWLGKISFSVYLLHWPILCSLTSYIYLSTGLSRNLNILISSTFTLVFIFLASSLYTKFIDQKSIIVARKIGELVKNKLFSHLNKLNID